MYHADPHLNSKDHKRKQGNEEHRVRDYIIQNPEAEEQAQEPMAEDQQIMQYVPPAPGLQQPAAAAGDAAARIAYLEALVTNQLQHLEALVTDLRNRVSDSSK